MTIKYLAETEVGYLDVPDACAAKDVFWLNISVHDTHLVKVSHALHQRVDHGKRLPMVTSLENPNKHRFRDASSW